MSAYAISFNTSALRGSACAQKFANCNELMDLQFRIVYTYMCVYVTVRIKPVGVIREKTGAAPWLFLIVLTELSRDQTPESWIQVRPLVRPGS